MKLSAAFLLFRCGSTFFLQKNRPLKFFLEQELCQMTRKKVSHFFSRSTAVDTTSTVNTTLNSANRAHFVVKHPNNSRELLLGDPYGLYYAGHSKLPQVRRPEKILEFPRNFLIFFCSSRDKKEETFSFWEDTTTATFPALIRLPRRPVARRNRA